MAFALLESHRLLCPSDSCHLIHRSLAMLQHEHIGDNQPWEGNACPPRLSSWNAVNMRGFLQALRHLLNGWIFGEGDVMRQVSLMGIRLNYRQDPLSEFDFGVTNIASDLRDGLRLCRVAEVLAGTYCTLCPLNCYQLTYHNCPELHFPSATDTRQIEVKCMLTSCSALRGRRTPE